MNDTGKRAVVYGASAALVAGLVWAGFVREVEADAFTLIGAAKMHVQLAAGIPVRDGDERAREVRDGVLADAEALLDRAETVDPDTTTLWEMRAWVAYLRGDYRGSAAHYATAALQPDSTPEIGASHRLNQARMLLTAGDAAAALAIVDGEGFVPLAAFERRTLRARTRWQLGDREAALAIVEDLANADDNALTARLQAGFLYEEFGLTEAAGGCYDEAARIEPAAHYYRARLKLRSGEFDISLDLLERAVDAARPHTLRLLRRDRDEWRAVADTERFRELRDPSGPAAPNGR